jgi:hypothetical protein
VVAAIIGGILLGFGISRFAHHPSIAPGTMALVGLILLWYALADRRKAQDDTPESETHGGHTIE